MQGLAEHLLFNPNEDSIYSTTQKWHFIPIYRQHNDFAIKCMYLGWLL